MRAFVQKPKAPQQATPAKSPIPGRAHLGHIHQVGSTLHRQRGIGNQAALRLLEASTRNAKGDSVTDRASVGYDFNRIPMHANAIAEIQPKLAIGTPGDTFEQEADRTAEQVMRMSAPGVTISAAPPHLSRKCSDCEEDEKLQKKPDGPQVSASEAPAIVHEVLRSPGEPLDAATRAFFEPRFDHDFTHVRVHSDAKAAASARDVGALAYTVGADLVFASGVYNPSSESGRKLLAHELTHHVQQSAQPSRASPTYASAHDAEAEANRNAERFNAGAPAEVNVATPISVAMKGVDGNAAADRSYWFQSEPPRKPISTESDIQIMPKGQVFLDPIPLSVLSPLGTFSVQFAGLDSDFRNGKPIAAFAAAENAIIKAIECVICKLRSLPPINGLPSPKAVKAQRKEDETVRARLKESVRTLDGKTLNVFIATELSVLESVSKRPWPRTEQIFVRAEDIGDAKKLEAGIRLPLILFTGGDVGLPPGRASLTALDAEQTEEALLHEMVHVMLINKGVSSGQVWQAAQAGIVTGPDEVKHLAEDVLFRYVRAQEELFVFKAIGGVYTGFAIESDHYVKFIKDVETFLHDIGAKLDKPKTTKIDVKEKGITWSIAYTLPKPITLDAKQKNVLESLQKSDTGS